MVRRTVPRAAHRSDRPAEGVCQGRTGEGGEPAGTGQGPGGEPVEDPADGGRGAWACSLTGRKQGDAAVELHHKGQRPEDGDRSPGPCFLVCTIIAVIAPSSLSRKRPFIELFYK